MSKTDSNTLSPLSHPGLYCIALPLTALALGVALAVQEQMFNTSHGDPRVLESWASLAIGAGVGIVFVVPQKRQLRRHRDFLASQCIRGHARGLAVELEWLHALWPALTSLGVAIAAAGYLGWPAIVALAGALGSNALLYWECRSIHILAKRLLAAKTSDPG